MDEGDFLAIHECIPNTRMVCIPVMRVWVGLFVAGIGWIIPFYGDNTVLEAQPETAATGFRVFMSIPPLIGSGLAVLALRYYPLHGERLHQVKAALDSRSSRANKTAHLATFPIMQESES